MAKKQSEASLRKKLKQMDEVSLIQMIIDLYEATYAKRVLKILCSL